MTSQKSENALKQAIRFSKKIVVVMFASVFVFTAGMVVTYYITGAVPEILVEQFFGFFGIEGGALCAIKIAETIIERVFDRKKEKNYDGFGPMRGE